MRNVNTRSAEAKPLYKIDKLVSILVSFKPDFWNLVVAHDMERGKDVWGSLEGKEARNTRIVVEPIFWNFLIL